MLIIRMRERERVRERERERERENLDSLRDFIAILKYQSERIT